MNLKFILIFWTSANSLLILRLPQLMDVVRSNYEAMIDRAHGGPNFMMHSGISQASEYDDPPGLREKAEYLLREWVNLYHSAAAGRDSTKAFSAFVGQVSTPLQALVFKLQVSLYSTCQ